MAQSGEMGVGALNVIVISSDPEFAGALAAELETLEGTGTVDVYADPEHAWTCAQAADVIILHVVGPVFPIFPVEHPPVLAVGPLRREALVAAVESGSLGYLPADTTFETIGAAAVRVAAGEAVIPSEMLGSLLRHVVQRRRSEREAMQRLSALTDREREVFGLASQGLTSAQIGEALYISSQTARTHVQKILTKLDLHSRAELAALAAQCGIVPPEVPDDR